MVNKFLLVLVFLTSSVGFGFTPVAPGIDINDLNVEPLEGNSFSVKGVFDNTDMRANLTMVSDGYYSGTGTVSVSSFNKTCAYPITLQMVVENNYYARFGGYLPRQVPRVLKASSPCPDVDFQWVHQQF